MLGIFDTFIEKISVLAFWEDISRLHSFRVSDLLLSFCLPRDMCGDKMQTENPR